MKIVTILGARPQFIKAGSVSREIAKYPNIKEIIIHTGQHYDANMSHVFFEEIKIPKPDYFLGIGGKSHGAMTGQMIEKIEEILVNEKPDWVMVYGDTNSTLAGAISASKLHIKIAHVEAGLRSFNMRMPEEINRILTDRVSSILFCPTNTAVQNLTDEGFNHFACRIVQSGDVMQDGAMFYKQFAKKPNFQINNNFILCTIHRAENTDNEQNLRNIFKALEAIVQDKQVILPLHPRTKKIVEELELNIKHLTIIQPVGYLEMVWLIDHCALVITDSGGLQKEAFFFKKHCVILREETEWSELVDNGFNLLAGSDNKKIITCYHSMISKISNFAIDLYGSGTASELIIKELMQ